MTSVLINGSVQPSMADYFYFLYFGGFFAYYVLFKKDFTIMAMLSRWQDKKFWFIVGITILWMGIAYAVGFVPSILFAEYNIYFAEVSFTRGYNLPTRILCLFSTILFPAIGQELFYRKNMIRFNSKLALTATTIASCILFGINDSLDLFGIVRSSLLGLSLAISYIKTKDIYVQITAHLLANLTMSLIL